MQLELAPRRDDAPRRRRLGRNAPWRVTINKLRGPRHDFAKWTSDPNLECKACANSAGMFANFVGMAPIDQPRWVIYVGVGQPSKEGTGGTIAAPAFSRVATRLLAL